jgi:SlyX protein
MPPGGCQSRAGGRSLDKLRIDCHFPGRLPLGHPAMGDTMSTADDRLTTLEMRAAEQEKTIEELSGQIAEQWKTVEALRRKLDALADRFLVLEEQTAPDVPITKPPHW